MSLPKQTLHDGIVIADQFRLERELGRGGMGTVWVAHDQRLGRDVAIKFLAKDYLHDEQARLRFQREPRLAARIRSPHVVQVFAEGVTDEGLPYLVMELLEGEDLSARIARLGRCSLVEAGAIIDQTCRALSRAHREGLVHRDIKPHNIFLTPEGDEQVFVKLLDFGIAKDVGARVTALTVRGDVMGTMLYASPEQLRDSQSVGPSTDVWAVGVVIYEMLTGRVPFEANSWPEVFMRVNEGRFAPATQLVPGLPAAIDAFLSKAIQPDLGQRFKTVDELGSAFLQLVRAHASGVLTRGSADGGIGPVSSLVGSSAYPNPYPAPAAVTSPDAATLPTPTRNRGVIVTCVALLIVAAGLGFVWLRRDHPLPAATDAHVVQPAAAPSRVIMNPAPEPPPPPSAAAPPPPVAPETKIPERVAPHSVEAPHKHTLHHASETSPEPSEAPAPVTTPQPKLRYHGF